MDYVTILWLFSLCSSEIQAHTHWMVTDAGLIQPRVDSQFLMARPYDLLAFLNQDTRWENIINYYHQMHDLQDEIDRLWAKLEKEADSNYFLSLDPNCYKAGALNSLDWYASHLEDGLSKNIDRMEYKLKRPVEGEDVDIPDCKKISSLTFSMAAFEHLLAMINRDNLSSNAESTLPEVVSPIMNTDQFGHWVATMLRRNSSSWLHYNLASLYWRVKGNAPKALECSRRAVHYAPREYKGIALLSLGTTLHRAKKSRDASVVLEASIDHESQISHSHFILANTYAVLGEYNSSVKHYEACLKIDPSFEMAAKNMYGVKCSWTALKKVGTIHQLVADLKSNLTEYGHKEQDWLKAQAAFLRTMQHSEPFDDTKIQNVVNKISELTGLPIKDLKPGGDRNSLILYFLKGPLYNPGWGKEEGIFAMESVNALQKSIKHISKQAEKASYFVVQPALMKLPDGKIVKEIGPMPVFPDVSRGRIVIDHSKPGTLHAIKQVNTKTQNQEKPKQAPVKGKVENAAKFDDRLVDFEVGLPLYPSNMKVSRTVHDFDREADWPSESVCRDSGPSFPQNVEVIYPVFLPFENKGLRLHGLLTHKIGVPAQAEHELPWRPPTCPANKEAATYTQKKVQRQQLIEVVPAPYLRTKLMEYAGDGTAEFVTNMQDAEVGQRIYSAMKKNLAPKWLLYTLSSLYWRVRGNKVNALSCLLTASKTVKGKYKDVVMTSLASVFLEMGFVDEALHAAEESFKLNAYEPATNFVIAQIQMAKKNRVPQVAHLKQTVRVEAGFLDGRARAALTAWACLLRQLRALRGLAEHDESEICKDANRAGAKMCEGDDECHLSPSEMKCMKHREKDSTSTIIRLMDTQTPSHPEAMDGTLEPFISRMPESGDLAGHEDNLELMLDILQGLKGCGVKPCSSITPEDLALKEEDCTYQFLQLNYWMNIISFRQLFEDSELGLPSEILAMTPSTKSNIPDCRVIPEPSTDFFLDKLQNIDLQGWEPLLSLMQQFGELFQFVDFTVLGAKIARYVETRVGWWAGAVAAGWWCAAAGAADCTSRCMRAAVAAGGGVQAHRALAALLHLQNKTGDAKLVAQLAFYLSPKSKAEAFLLASSHTYHAEYDQAVWLYRYALSLDENYLPAKACLHATMCVMLFSDKAKTEA